MRRTSLVLVALLLGCGVPTTPKTVPESEKSPASKLSGGRFELEEPPLRGGRFSATRVREEKR